MRRRSQSLVFFLCLFLIASRVFYDFSFSSNFPCFISSLNIFNIPEHKIFSNIFNITEYKIFNNVLNITEYKIFYNIFNITEFKIFYNILTSQNLKYSITFLISQNIKFQQGQTWHLISCQNLSFHPFSSVKCMEI